MSAMLAQRRRAAAAKAAALAVKAGASAYAVSEKGGGLTYGEVDAEDLLKCVNTFCAPLPDGGFWDLGSGAGSAALAAAHAFDAFAAGSGGVELQPRLHGLAVEARGRLAAWAGADAAGVLDAALAAAAAAAAAGAALDPDATEAAVAAILGRRGLRHALAGVAATSLEGYVSAKAPFARGAFRAEAGAWTRADGAADADAARARRARPAGPAGAGRAARGRRAGRRVRRGRPVRRGGGRAVARRGRRPGERAAVRRRRQGAARGAPRGGAAPGRLGALDGAARRRAARAAPGGRPREDVLDGRREGRRVSGRRSTLILHPSPRC